MKRLCIIVFLIIVATTATAGTNPFGVRGGWATSPDQFFVGGQLLAKDLSPEMNIVPNVEFGFGDNISIYSFNAALHYAFLSSNMNGFQPYVGGELGFNVINYDDEISGGVSSSLKSQNKMVINGVAGMKKRMDDKKEMFFELKLGLSDYANDLKILSGLNFF